MERKQFVKLMAFAGLLPAVFLAACGETTKKENDTTVAVVQTYTCPMHPQIVQNKMGTCPICGMDLVLFDKNNKEASLTLSESQIALANITTVVAGSAVMNNSRTLNGRIVTNPEQTMFMSSRVAGRVENLYVRETGVKVEKGQLLYRIYSEELSALQQEYLMAVAQAKQFPGNARFSEIGKAAKQKLKLYDQSDAQLAALLQSGKVDPYVNYFATGNGMVAELSVTEGQYVSQGSPVMRLEGYGKLWVEADLYPAEAPLVRTGQTVMVLVSGYEQEPQRMTINFISPALQSGSQLMQVRGEIANPGNRWQPGLQANVILPVQGDGNALTLPVDAVIRNGKGAHVWVQTGKGKFEPRRVKTGIENADRVEILEGIASGDTVVVTGAYLLYSEFILKKGSDPMAAHNH
ncbi:efflux RND transporter periplasmic adaptor subunit [Pseudobacter ginsenosidimutans]|jgi:Cu(I)/Ag(I) efflux system membrane fusion protein|uniref:Cu(I)/Ag(I) efflux system membrane fusion protein n=1 Tax=Pseudobacter ginsenosidimutans TaxID=661488 RepID=A0A4V2F227_9BACT|nr:efflux RND transporter periplasmic adaptor subunit [Pseudobacter ginsenosidimutans]QEC44351.1 efflux RND transporter periplasmic adaptor subunit [Pseudobacter ginsenosidimutans]RZS75817.1 Cu(I)/Ag(I) efflux system membrane fusion protein [Pseudobacter ginsenosidimutans]